MVRDDYMLILGSNVYADPVYNLSYQPDGNSGDRIPLFTLENCDGSLLLTTEIRDENSEIIAKIDKNEFIRINENFDVQGEIEKENGLVLTKKDDGTVILNAKITEDQYVEVTGTFYVGDRKIRVTDRTVEINDVPKKSVNGVDMHDTIFVGTCNITITDDGLKI
ncbi:hypothetical protein EQO05_12655 [Methanosarcina sp. MSH10X1]|uniref:hypothetical protein n=1 Tax=Methanosarcina sp. MSH10X1 TaxID=2507075 RepID=UPI000FFC7D9B|nr:hypothetical protein [Methanosarcina sp. MSH10X1]RXA17273.1 hypothetical protein EQO05_12655 [Methanosarcina sp. MSH10X1]